MEFDNDRPIKPAYKIEIFYWVLLGIMNPLVNSLTLFLSDIRIWGALLFANVIVLPVYLLYQVTIVPRFLFQKRNTTFFILISLLFFVVIQVLLFIIYSVVLKFPLSSYEKLYFTFNYSTIIRETL